MPSGINRSDLVGVINPTTEVVKIIIAGTTGPPGPPGPPAEDELPEQLLHQNEVLTTDGINPKWADPASLLTVIDGGTFF